MACTFCSRDTGTDSTWSAEGAFEVLAGLAKAGVLEVAFGGGEPWAFPRFEDLVRRLYYETPLAVNFTTNGRLLTGKRLAAIQGCYGQCRLSLYDDNDWPRKVVMLANADARFGVNYLVTPERLLDLETTVFELVALGCRDILLLSYNGRDPRLHLSHEQSRALARILDVLARALSGRCQLKLDVCWGERLESVPRLFSKRDCGAGVEFLVVTSDRKVMPCSFHHLSIPARSAEDVLEVWRTRRLELSSASQIPGCARAPGYGLRTLPSGSP